MATKFADLGKSAKDLFSKNYGFGETKVEVKTNSTTGAEFTVTGTKNAKTGAINGSLETKYKYAPYNLTLTEKWNTKNQINLEVAVEDQVAKGLKLGVEAGFAPSSGDKSAKFTTAFKQGKFHFTNDLDITNGPSVNSSGVVEEKGIIAGFDASYNVSSSALTKTHFALGYKAADFTLHALLDGPKLSTSLFHIVKPTVLTAVQFSWNRSSNETSLELGGQYFVDKNTFFKAKVDTKAQLGLSVTQQLQPGVKVTLSAQVDTNNLDKDAHKLGLHLLLEA